MIAVGIEVGRRRVRLARRRQGGGEFAAKAMARIQQRQERHLLRRSIAEPVSDNLQSLARPTVSTAAHWVSRDSMLASSRSAATSSAGSCPAR